MGEEEEIVAARMRKTGVRSVVGAMFLVLAPLVVPDPGQASAEPTFPRPASLEPNIEFWRNIFASYSRNQTVLHDNEHLDRVYAVLDFQNWAGENGRLDAKHDRLRREREKAARARIVSVLRSLHTKRGRPSSWTPEEQRVARMFEGETDSRRFSRAAERVRLQSGMRERFRQGLARLKGYEPQMAEIFRSKGLPSELTRMTLVESSFDLEAYSKAGAAGVWQFMPRTGRQYLRIDSAIDERRDPLRSTRAAAEHLRRDKEALGSWPLAITAYNHGRGGISRAVRTVGSKDIGVISRKYKGRAFGFASRNFYAEFLAVLDITFNERHYLGGVVPAVPAPRAREVPLKTRLRLHQVSDRLGVGYETLIAMNPAFLRRVIDGRSTVPKGYRVRVPISERDERLALQQADASRSARGRPRYAFHQVTRGQTLGGIARRYGTTASNLQRINGIRKPRSLQIGTVLRVPQS